MKRLKISLLLLFGLSPLCRLEGHGYIFSKTVEEMRDQIAIFVESEQIMIQYESEYLGQIAPHIRIMIDANADSVLTTEEVNIFFAKYQKLIDETLPILPLFIDAAPATIELIDILAPTIQTDSLLAPFKIGMIFKIKNLKIEPGEHELVIDPKLLFSNGDNFIQMAKKSVEFTDEQEKAIGRFLQIKLFTADSILFTSSYPGYIKKDKKSVFIHGVFYDETILRIKNSQYPKLRVRFTSL